MNELASPDPAEPCPAGQAYITACGAFLPGEAVLNDEIEARLGIVGPAPSTLRAKVLAANGILTRHYALDDAGNTTMLNEELAARAVQAALQSLGRSAAEVTMIAAGTTQGDLPVPGFASMVHGRLGAAPVETLSAGGVCASSFTALRAAANAVRLGEHELAAVVGSELVSRIMKASRFDPADADNFDAEFLRWMLSDGAGAVLVEPRPRRDGPSLRIDWTHVRSHAHEHDVCMYVGSRSHDAVGAGATWLDHPTISDADRLGALNLRQDVSQLPGVIALGVAEFVRLVQAGTIDPDGIDHVLCHYSSTMFRSEIFKLMADAGYGIAEEKWFSNLATKGNTGAASIFIMLEEAFNGGRFKQGDRILLMVPESGRFTVAFAQLTVVGPERDTSPNVRCRTVPEGTAFPRAGLAGSADVAGDLLAGLAEVWAGFETRLATIPIVARIEAEEATIADYRMLLVNLRQQVAEGARWISRAASNLGHHRADLRFRFVQHAAAEQHDFRMLEHDYVAVGGNLADIQRQPKNVGSVALSAFMFHQADQPDPLDLLGAMFVIEGLGSRKALRWARLLQRQLGLDAGQTTFLAHHGTADVEHTETLGALLRHPAITAQVADAILATARTTARLYALQLEELEPVRRVR